MKVTTPTDLSAQVPKPGTTPGEKSQHTAAATAQQTASSSGVSVSVSQQVRTLTAPESGAQSDVDLQKVANVTAAIQNGTYKIDPHAIADNLLASTSEFIQPVSH